MTGVVFAWLFSEDTSGWFTYSAVDMVRWDSLYGSNYLSNEEGGFITISTGPRVAEARNMVVDQFAKNHPSAEWLLFLDSDMTFTGDLLERLMEHAHPEKVPILGALCFAGGRANRTYPTVWRETDVEWTNDQGWVNIEKVYDYPRNQLCKVAATGAAALLIHRNVLGAMRNKFGKTATGVENQYPWFAEGLVGPGGQPLGEDVAFCIRARTLGIPVHVHTGIKTGHMKAHEIDEDHYIFERASRGESLPYDVEPQVGQTVAAPNRAARRAAAREKQKQ